MITYGIIMMFYGLAYSFTYPLRILDDVVLTENISSAITTAGQYIAMTDYVLPLATLASVLALFITIEASILAYKLVMWVIRKIPGIS
jgi:hypothetical protein